MSLVAALLAFTSLAQLAQLHQAAHDLTQLHPAAVPPKHLSQVSAISDNILVFFCSNRSSRCKNVCLSVRQTRVCSRSISIGPLSTRVKKVNPPYTGKGLGSARDVPEMELESSGVARRFWGVGVGSWEENRYEKETGKETPFSLVNEFSTFLYIFLTLFCPFLMDCWLVMFIRIYFFLHIKSESLGLITRRSILGSVCLKK